jgi:hypothetical protein
MGRIYLDEDVSADGQKLILDANKNADYQTLIEEKFFRQMLAYPFSWISNRKSNSKLDMIQGRMGGLLTYTQEEFDREPDNEGYEFDEKDFKDYQRKFLDTMEKQLIDEIVKDLRRENLLPNDILSKEILTKMKEMGFILSDLDNNNKLQRTMKAKKTAEGFREGLPFGAMDDDTTGGFIGAFLDSRPILYEEIKDHIEVKKPNQIIFDTEKYIEKISVAEGYGKLEKEDSKLTIAGSRGRELNKEVEIFSVGKTNDGRYRMEGFGKTRLIDDIDETWDVYRNLLSLENLEKYIEKVILSQKQSPLKNILLSLVEPEDRMLEVGKLNIFVDNLSVGGNQSVGFGNTDPLTKETWMKWLRRTEDKKVEGNKDVKMVESLMNLAFDLFDEVPISPDEAGWDGLASKIDNNSRMTKVKEKKFRGDTKENLPKRTLADLTVEQLYDIWESNGKPTSADPDKVDDLANALLRQASGKDVIEITRDKEGRKFPVLESGKGKTGMVRLRVNFRPTKLVSAKDYEIYQERIDAGGRRMPEPKERDRLGTETRATDRRLGGRRGPVTATELDRKRAQDVEKDFKSIMELKLGYNRLKGLVG